MQLQIYISLFSRGVPQVGGNLQLSRYLPIATKISVLCIFFHYPDTSPNFFSQLSLEPIAPLALGEGLGERPSFALGGEVSYLSTKPLSTNRAYRPAILPSLSTTNNVGVPSTA
jgi:hypothetical protein